MSRRSGSYPPELRERAVRMVEDAYYRHNQPGMTAGAPTT
ncbi:MAG: hypothetical protein JWO79_403 [Actinomycetia bacterium]|nr:hypothetical protein [Actinomycetes bacterium]